MEEGDDDAVALGGAVDDGAAFGALPAPNGDEGQGERRGEGEPGGEAVGAGVLGARHEAPHRREAAGADEA
ncbi:MAG: hypothetical protein AAFW01_01750, partial [Pseudomonadota bacterium]